MHELKSRAKAINLHTCYIALIELSQIAHSIHAQFEKVIPINLFWKFDWSLETVLFS